MGVCGRGGTDLGRPCDRDDGSQGGGGRHYASRTGISGVTCKSVGSVRTTLRWRKDADNLRILCYSGICDTIALGGLTVRAPTVPHSTDEGFKRIQSSLMPTKVQPHIPANLQTLQDPPCYQRIQTK